MNDIFQIDSPLMRGLSRITDLMALNVLWLLCCLPLITAGASTSAMYSVLFRQQLGLEDAVIRPFFRAFRENLKQGIILWLPGLIGIALLVFDGLFLYSMVTNFLHPLWLVFYVVAFLILSYCSFFPAVIARYHCQTRHVFGTCISLCCLNPIAAISVVVLNLVVPLCVLFLPEFVYKTLPLWLFFGSVLPAFLNSVTFLRVFSKYADEPKEASERSEASDS